jgi:hypothetical protein
MEAIIIRHARLGEIWLTAIRIERDALIGANNKSRITYYFSLAEAFRPGSAHCILAKGRMK